MAKKSSKASIPSWRTLMRRAKLIEKKSPAEAKNLRAQAAFLRHGGKPKKTRRSKPVVATSLAPSARAEAVRAVRQDWDEVNRATAGRGLLGEQLTGNMAAAANNGAPVNVAPLTIAGVNADTVVADIMSASRKKGGQQEILKTLLAIQGAAQYEGARKSDQDGTDRLKEVQRRIDEKIVCGFLSEVDVQMQITGGLPPDQVWNVNSYIITKIVDALNRAGYTPKGRVNGADREEKRGALMGKSHNEVHGLRAGR